eukprot:484585-Alexandrium_andersonii.AAC.1
MAALRPGPASPRARARQQRVESPLQVARVAGAVVEIAHAADLQVGLELSVKCCLGVTSRRSGREVNLMQVH